MTGITARQVVSNLFTAIRLRSNKGVSTACATSVPTNVIAKAFGTATNSGDGATNGAIHQ